jgi:hypothetical protein
VLLAIVVAAGWLGWREYQRLLREDPQSIPWTPLSLADPVGRFSAQKLARLADDPDRCRTLLDADGSAAVAAPPISTSDGICGYADGLRLRPDSAASIRFAPDGLVTACPVVAALRVWERAVQVEAERAFESRVARIEHFGSYSCRRRYGASQGAWSEHATADAVDIAAFRLGDGRRVSVVNGWTGDAAERSFLRAVRDHACDLFSVTLSPDYNAAHRDHLHFDMSAFGRTGAGICR